MTSSLTNLLSDLNSVFEQTGSRWYLFGAQAAIIHGAARLTADVDVTVIYGDRPVDDLIEALVSKEFEIRVTDAAEFVARSRVLPVLHLRSGIPVDIVLGGPGLEEDFAVRASQYDIENVKVPVASSEDVVAMKILAGREKDLDDALSIVTAQFEKLDLERIRNILGMLEEALARRDLIPILDDLIRRAKS